MIKVLFFARIREELDCPRMDVQWRGELADLDSLQGHLVAQKGERWRKVLEQHNVIRAVNQVVVEGNTALADGDEVAFFPPVTGG